MSWNDSIRRLRDEQRFIGAFPCENAVLRLLVPLAVDTNAKWLDRRYVSWDNLKHTRGAEDEFTEEF
jgi:hypothetical protein